eukprot:69576-Heterocapsa_arctica.AAC.1
MGWVREKSPGKGLSYCPPLLQSQSGCPELVGSVGSPQNLRGRAGKSSVPHCAWALLAEFRGQTMSGLPGLAPVG